MNPILILIAGPNGAGKSTFYQEQLAHSSFPFINADLIAKEVFGNQDPENALVAAKLAESLRQEKVTSGNSFIFETVLSDPAGAKIEFLKKAQEAGFIVEAHFIGIASPILSQARVIHRVQSGGHDVPDKKIRSRYPRVMANLQRLIPVADRLTIYDNSEVDRPLRPLARFQNGALLALASELPAWVDFLNLPNLTNTETKTLS